MASRALVAITLLGCGRLGFDAQSADGASDSISDSISDTISDGPTIALDFTQVCPGPVSVIGNAACATGAMRLTSAAQAEQGAVWWPVQFPSISKLSAELEVTIQPPPALPPLGTGDGFALVIQNDPRGTAALGDGGSLGYGGAPRITPSLIAEVDTFSDTVDPLFDHVGISVDGEDTSIAVAPIPFALDSGGTVFLWVDYEAVPARFEVRIAQTATRPIAPTVSSPVSFTGPGYVGVVAGTLAAFEEHRLLRMALTIEP